MIYINGLRVFWPIGVVWGVDSLKTYYFFLILNKVTFHFFRQTGISEQVIIFHHQMHSFSIV